MSASEKTINTFATRVRQMILKFEDIKHENAELYARPYPPIRQGCC